MEHTYGSCFSAVVVSPVFKLWVTTVATMGKPRTELATPVLYLWDHSLGRIMKTLIGIDERETFLSPFDITLWVYILMEFTSRELTITVFCKY